MYNCTSLAGSTYIPLCGGSVAPMQVFPQSFEVADDGADAGKSVRVGTLIPFWRVVSLQAANYKR